MVFRINLNMPLSRILTVVEVEGVRRALKRAEEADIKVVVLDASVSGR